jgi:hydrogenase-4 membrane subunit HyfE
MALAESLLAASILIVTLWLLVARRVGAAIGGYALQSVLLGALALVLFAISGLSHLLLLGLLTVAIKGLTIPLILRRQLRGSVYEQRETSYYLGFPTALLVGMALAGVGFAAAARFPLLGSLLGRPVLGIGIATALLGFFTTTARRDAVMQVAGLLAAENGLLVVGLVISPGLDLLVEFALFLDVLIGALVMGFLIVRMHQTLASTDTSELRRLRG